MSEATLLPPFDAPSAWRPVSGGVGATACSTTSWRQLAKLLHVTIPGWEPPGLFINRVAYFLLSYEFL